MYSYNLMQWLLFFGIYCIVGWVWETLYVSVLKGQWVNRGFLHGPFLPIYGCGATVMLLVSIPVKDNLVLNFLLGMLSATTMEYFTGAAMEKMFGVRYWDYSDDFLNLNGHICLKASLTWGVFSVLLVRFIHKPIEGLVMGLSFTSLQVISLIFMAYFSSDMSLSFKEALDLKELLNSLTENNEELKRIERRIEIVSTVIGTEVKEKSTEGLKALNKTLETSKQRVEAAKEAVNEHKIGLQKKHKSVTFVTRNVIQNNLNRAEKVKTEYIGALSDRVSEYLDKMKATRDFEEQERSMENGMESSPKEKKSLMTELEEFQNKLSARKLHEKASKSYLNAVRLIRRNPSAISEQYAEALAQLKNLDCIQENDEES